MFVIRGGRRPSGGQLCATPGWTVMEPLESDSRSAPRSAPRPVCPLKSLMGRKLIPLLYGRQFGTFHCHFLSRHCSHSPCQSRSSPLHPKKKGEKWAGKEVERTIEKKEDTREERKTANSGGMRVGKTRVLAPGTMRFLCDPERSGSGLKGVCR
jgi:hypothetical protein